MRYAYTDQSLLASIESSQISLSSISVSGLTKNRVERIESNWLIVSPHTGAWCLLNQREYSYYKDIIKTSCFDVADLAPEARKMLRHLLRCGLLDSNHTAVSKLYPPKPFSVTIYQSNRCSLVCKYCYLSMVPRQHGRELSTKIACNLIGEALETDSESLLIDFGEISVGFHSIRKLIHYAESLHQFYPRKQLIFSIQTNGTSLKRHDVIDFLQDHNVLVGVSLDGPQQLHDRVRISSSGHGSHACIEAGLSEIIRRGIPHIVLCTISSANVRSAHQILDYFLEIGVSHFSFKPIIRRGHADTEWQALGISTNEYCVFLQSVLDYAISNRNWDALDDRLTKFIFRLLRDPRGWSDRCPTPDCGCGTDMIVINPEGFIYPCPRFTSTERDGKHIGQSLSEALTAAQDLIYPVNFHRVGSKCHECLWWALCRGGCPLSRIQNYTTSGNAIDPFCEIYGHMYNLIITQLIPCLGNSATQKSSKLGNITIVDTDIFSESG